MEKLKYESPKFEFEELKLAERVADTCWGFHFGWYDINGDGKHDSDEIIDFGSIPDYDYNNFIVPYKNPNKDSCSAVESKLVKYLKDCYGLEVSPEEVKTNSHSQLVRPIES